MPDVCTCYIDNQRRDPHRQRVTAVVDCPKHTTPALQALVARGQALAREEARTA